MAASFSELPEANHNEIEGWSWGLEHAPLSAVLLTAPGLHARVARRIELHRGAARASGACPVHEVAARGDTPVAHVLSLVMLGDLVSVRWRSCVGVDAGPGGGRSRRSSAPWADPDRCRTLTQSW